MKMAAVPCRLMFLMLVSFWALCRAQMRVNPNMRSFSSATKGGHLNPNEELVLYESNTGEPGVITEQWFTGKVMDENATIRIYVDNETLPGIEFQLLLGHGIGFVDNITKAAPWNTKRISLDADHGTYDTYQIPFSKSFKVTATHPVGGTFWYIIRGVYNYPLIVGELELPSNTRLRLYKNVNVTMEPLEFIDLADIRGSAGFLFQVTIAASSVNYHYLEGCVRAYIDGSSNTTFLSSGTEDFFLSAYYFNEGLFHSDNSGLTYKDNKGKMSAYKFFEDDPILFKNSLLLRWRCGEKVGNGLDDCHNYFKLSERISAPNIETATVTTYTWVYEYEWQ